MAEVVALRDLSHGDWKTASVRPGKWPTIPKGTRCTVVKRWQNLYGDQLEIIGPNGEHYDVKPGDVAAVDRGTSLG